MRTFALCLTCFLGAGCAAPIALHTYGGEVMVYPDFLPTNRPTILAFLDGNDRRCDRLVKPLRALASREEVELVGVLAYDDNAFLDQISTKREIVFPMILDPKKKMVDEFSVKKYPTYIYVSPAGKEVARAYEIAKAKEWYKQEWIHRAFGRKYTKSPKDLAEEDS